MPYEWFRREASRATAGSRGHREGGERPEEGEEEERAAGEREGGWAEAAEEGAAGEGESWWAERGEDGAVIAAVRLFSLPP